MKRKKITSFAPDWSVRIFFVLVISFGVFLHLYSIRQLMAGQMQFPLPILLFILALDAYLLWTMFMVFQTKVTLYDEGIEVERGASKLFTTWDNVSHMGKNGMGRSVATGLYLHEPAKTESEGLAERLLLRENSKFIPLGRFMNIPSDWTSFFSRDVDMDKILETDFGKQLYELAPHLFEQEAKLKNRLEDSIEAASTDAIDEQDSHEQSQA
jgi:hypothetical protein